MWAMKKWILMITTGMTFYTVTSYQCLSAGGKPVDWFIIYKSPKKTSSQNKHIQDGTGFYYMDVNKPSWTLSTSGIDGKDHALYNTLQQIYQIKDNGSMFTMYNDEPPPSQLISEFVMYNDEQRKSQGSKTYGHTKGALAFSKSEGFWMISSVPGFPPRKKDGYDYPTKHTPYGQTILCISLGVKALDYLGTILMYNFPHIYDNQFPANFATEYPNMAKVMGKSQQHVQSPPWSSVGTLTSTGGQTFQVFAKAAGFNADLYDALIAPSLRATLWTETWRREQPLSSNCTGAYQVLNIEELKFPDVTFKSGSDHSKWAVSSTPYWICIGDINRAAKQFKRGGGSVCFKNENVWNEFKSRIASKESCKTQF